MFEALLPMFLGLMGIGFVLTCYYGIIFLFVYRRSRQLDPSSLPSPESLNAMSLRFFWVGDVDWNVLLVNFLQAAHKGIYRLIWKEKGTDFIMDLTDREGFSQLSSMERKGMGFNGLPLQQIITRVQKTRMVQSLLNNVTDHMEDVYASYLMPWSWIFRGGLLITTMMSLGAMKIAYNWGENVLIFTGVCLLLLGAYSQFLIAKWLDDEIPLRNPAESLKSRVRKSFNLIVLGISPTSKDQQWLKGFVGRIRILVQMAFICFIIYATGNLLVAYFWILIMTQMVLYVSSSRLNAKGIAMRNKIMTLRERLLKEEVTENEDISLKVALNIHSDTTEKVALLYIGRYSMEHSRENLSNQIRRDRRFY